MKGSRTIVTVQQHILEEQTRFPEASGEFSFLLSGVTLATKMIAAKVRRAGLTDILGSAEEHNVHGETQQKLDVYSNEVLLYCLSKRDTIGVIASEENEEPVILSQHVDNARYGVVFDPLDGSSNIDVNAAVGTTFSIYRQPEGDRGKDPVQWLLQPGRTQVAAGYVVYGSSTELVYSAGRGVHVFTLDPAIGAYVLSHENLRMPDQGKYYSVNEAYADQFPAPYQRYLRSLRAGDIGAYSSRYIGTMVADFHRTLLKGGVFLYPPTAKNPEGKLRLLYEANTVAYLAEQAGGVATDGERSVLDILPDSIHQRTSLVVGSKVEMAAFERVMAGMAASV